jgi:hypothetical protein
MDRMNVAEIMTPQAQQEDLLIIKVSLRTSVDILEKLV